MVNNIIKKELLNKSKEQIKKLNAQDLYSVFSSEYFNKRFENVKSTRGLIMLYKYAKKCDDMYPVLRGAGQKIEELLKDKNQVVALFENTSDGLQSDVIRKSLIEGLPIHYSQLDSESLVSEGRIKIVKNILDAMYMIKSTSNGKFLLNFPLSVVSENGEYTGSSFCELFNTDDENIYIKPKYIDSYLSFGYGTLNRVTKKWLEEILIKK